MHKCPYCEKTFITLEWKANHIWKVHMKREK